MERAVAFKWALIVICKTVVAFKWALIVTCKRVVRYSVISMTHYLSVRYGPSGQREAGTTVARSSRSGLWGLQTGSNRSEPPTAKFCFTWQRNQGVLIQKKYLQCSLHWSERASIENAPLVTSCLENFKTLLEAEIIKIFFSPSSF